jgi:hypothetical protein
MSAGMVTAFPPDCVTVLLMWPPFATVSNVVWEILTKTGKSDSALALPHFV